MTDDTRLRQAAYKAEHAASRKLAAAAGIGLAQALRQTLELAAGDGGVEKLLAAREAAVAADVHRRARRLQQKADAEAQRLLRRDGPPTPWRAWFDGSAHPNPGRCGIGALLTGPAGEVIEISRSAGYGNSSEAEYRALIAVLAAAVQCGAHGLTVFGDSQGVIDDVNGSDSAAAVSLRPLRSEALSLMAQLDDVRLRWLPRHRNAAADALSQRAIAAMAAMAVQDV